MSATERFDVIVAGGGIIGACLARCLGAAGLTVAVVDVSSPAVPGADDRAIALSLGSTRILTGIGLWARLSGETTAIERIHVSDRSNFGINHLNANDYRLRAFGYVVSARSLTQAVIAGLDRHAQMFSGARIESFEPGESNTCLTISTHDGPRQVTTSLLVIAEGANSATRELVGLSSTRHDYNQFALTANVTPGRAHENTAFERFTSSGPLAMLPMSDGRCGMIWTMNPNEKAVWFEAEDHCLLDELQRRFGRRLGRFSTIGARTAHPLSLVTVSSVVGPRTALVGNAAHTLHPIAGQGLNLGIRDVAVLAQAIVDAYRCSQDIGSGDLLEAYRADRHNDQRLLTRVTDSMVRIFSSEFVPWVFGRTVAMMTLECLPFAKEALVEHAIGLAGRQPRLARGLAL